MKIEYFSGKKIVFGKVLLTIINNMEMKNFLIKEKKHHLMEIKKK
jgi:hypothetical protein